VWPNRSAGFQTCCIADIHVGKPRNLSPFTRRRFGNPRYGRLGSLRYLVGHGVDSVREETPPGVACELPPPQVTPAGFGQVGEAGFGCSGPADCCQQDTQTGFEPIIRPHLAAIHLTLGNGLNPPRLAA
jgi:hypothetical protein